MGIKKCNFKKARELMAFAESRAKVGNLKMSRMEAYILHERIGECMGGK